MTNRFTHYLSVSKNESFLWNTCSCYQNIFLKQTSNQVVDVLSHTTKESCFSIIDVLKSKFFSLVLSFFFLFLLAHASSGQSISGIVFHDGNNNGAKDITESGYSGIVVTAYNSSGVASGNATSTAADGTYTITGLSAGNYRVEFTVPSNGLYPSALGSGSNSQIQFVAAGATNVNFGLYQPTDFCATADPRMITSCGLVAGMTVSQASWKYQDRQAVGDATITTHTEDFNAGEIGIAAAFATRFRDQKVFSSTIASPFTSVYPNAPDGIGAIYALDYSGPGYTKVGYKLLVNLASYINVTNQFPVDAGILDRFGEQGLSGIELSQDESTLYAINMGNGKLVKIDIAGVSYSSLPSTAPAAGQISEIDIPQSLAAPSNGRFRPSALKRRGIYLYVGGINDGASGSASDLQGVILRYNMVDGTWVKVFTFEPETWKAGQLFADNKSQEQWGSPNNDPTIQPDNTKRVLEPFFSDIVFDDNDNIIIGITDREVMNPNSNVQTGYIIRTLRNNDGSYTLESGGDNPPYISTASNTRLGGSNQYAGAGTGTSVHGPGGDYFFEQSTDQYHLFLFSGGLNIRPGTNELFGGATDPVQKNTFGARIWDWTNGTTVGGVNLGGEKIVRIVSADGICEPGWIEIGNLVWKDENNNGLQDGGDTGIAGVSVQLLDATGATILATAVTDANGNYIFSSDPARTSTGSHIYGLSLLEKTGYKVRILNAEGGSIQSPLSALFPTVANANSNGKDIIDSDGIANGNNRETSVVLGLDGQNDHTLDFGFSSTPICTIPTVGSPVATQATCTGSTANSDAKINVSGIVGGDKYSYGTDSTSFTYASATAFTGTTVSITGLSNPTVATTYYVRIYSGSETCFKTVSVQLQPKTCLVPCVKPTLGTPVTTQATCTGSTANNDAKLTLASITGGDRYSYGTDTTTFLYSSATVFGPRTSSVNKTGLPNPSVATTYYIRVYNGSDTCYKTVSVVLLPKTCLVPCVKPTVGSPVSTEATCTGTTANSDAKIDVSGISGGDKYSYGTDSTIFTYSSATTFTGATVNITGLANPSVATTYYVRIYNASDTCYKTVSVILQPKSCIPVCTKPAAGNDQIVCAGTSATLTGTSPTTGTWSAQTGNPAGATLSTTSAGVATVNFATTASGTHKFIYNIGTSCEDTMSVVVNAKPVIVDGSATICAGVSVDLTSKITGYASLLSPVWTVSTAGGTAVSTPTSVKPSTNTTYVLVAQNAAGCKDTANVVVTVTAKPNAGVDQTLACANAATNTLTTSTTLVPVTSGGTFTQIGTTPAVATIAGNAVSGMSVAGTYQFQYNVSGCLDTVSVTVNPCTGCVKPNAGVDASAVCQPTSTAKLTAVTTGGTWAAQTGNPSAATIDGNGNITGLSVAGTYKFVYSVTGGGITCTDTAQVVVNAKPLVADGSATICAGVSVDLTSKITGYASLLSPVWTVSTAGGTAVSTPTSVKPSTNTTYVLVAQNAAGCKDTANVVVTVTAKPNAGVDQTLACANAATNTLTTSTILVPVTSGGTFTQIGTTPAVTTIAGNTVSGMSVAGTYQFQYNVSGCLDTVSVTVNPCAGCVKPTVGSPVATQATCTGTTANSDAKIDVSGILGGDKYKFGTDSTTFTYASATTITGGIVSITGLANPSVATTYYVRIYNASETCYKTVSVILQPKSCTVVCIKPTVGSITSTKATCTLTTANNDAKLNLTGLVGGNKCSYGTSTVNFSYSTAITYTGSTLEIANLPNPSTSTIYYARVYNGAESCYTDVQVTLLPANCNTPCGSPNCMGIAVKKN